MSYTYLLHPVALEDYSEAYAWHENVQRGLGERFITAVRHKLEKIVANPETFGSRDRREFREAQVDPFPYLIVYKIYKRKKLVHISSIHHTKKDPSKKYRK